MAPVTWAIVDFALLSVKQLEAAVNKWWLLWLLETQQEHLRDIISVVRDSQ